MVLDSESTSGTNEHSGSEQRPSRLPQEAQARTLVVGASGQVGGRLLRHLERSGAPATALPASREERGSWLKLDLASLESNKHAESLLDAYPLASIFCVGGLTNVDGCESDRDGAFRTNAVGPKALAGYAFSRHIPFAYFSTEYVFAGLEEQPGPYDESAPTHPLNAYGESKLAGEQYVLDTNPDALIIRTTVVYGPDSRRMNFLYGVLRNLTAGTPMSVPDDQISTPTYNEDLVQAVDELVRARASGIFNVVGPEWLDRYAFSQKIAQHFGLDESLLRPTSTARLAQKARRPLVAGLSISKLARTLPHLRMRTVAQALTECAPELKEAFPSLSVDQQVSTEVTR